MKKKLTRLFSVLLAAVLVFGTLPISAMGTDVADPPASAADESAVESLVDESSAVDDAAQPEEQSAEDEGIAVQATDPSSFMRIFHLDCGRKYFSVEQIEDLIDTISAKGYTHMELAVGNDALRFLLDDMSVTVNDKTYSSEDVTAGIQNGNKNYYNAGSKNELTESEMNEIISYANSKNISIIPLVNSPGHMDAILDCMESLGLNNVAYNNSARTVDVANTNAVAFTQALIQKYIDYFAAQGCEYFNIGADEYANDVSNGFAALISGKQYGGFVSYVNTLATAIKAKGMTPMAFNDGIYYNENTSGGTFNTDIVVCYWTSGWGSYSPAPAAFLKDKGHQIINTNDAWYYVLGRKAGNSSGYTIATAQNGAQKTGCTDVPGENDPEVIGCMQCLWCDTPSAEYSAAEVSNVKTLIQTLAESNPTYFKTSTDVTPGITITPAENNDGTLTVGSTLVLNAGKTVTWTAEPTGVVELTSADETAAYSNGLSAQKVKVTAKEAGKATITAADAETGSAATFEVTVADTAATKKDTINLVVGESQTKHVNGEYTGEYATDDTSIATVSVAPREETKPALQEVTDKTLTSGGQYLIVNKSGEEMLTQHTETSNNKTYLKISGTATTDSTELWTWSDPNNDGTGTLQTTTSSYLTVGNNSSNVSASASANQTQLKLTYNANDKYWTIQTTGWRYFLYNRNRAARGSSDSSVTNSDSGRWIIYEIIPGSEGGTDITFTGESEGTTHVTIGDTYYTITVTAETGLSSKTKTIEYWNTNATVHEKNNTSAKSTTVSADKVNSKNGVALSTLVPELATSKYDKEVVFWKGTRLTSDNKQIEDGQTDSVDKSDKGDDFMYIRYWGGKWSFSSDQSTWYDFNNTDQIVAYYMQRTKVTPEVTTDIVDWGPDYAGYTAENFVILDFARAYESGDKVPNTFPVTGKTVAFHCDSGDKNTVHTDSSKNTYRTLGSIRAVNSDDYEVYMITLTPSSDDNKASASVANTASEVESITYGGTEKVVWVDDAKNIPERLSGKKADGYTEGGEPFVKSLNIYNKHAMLVTYYIREIVKEDSLTVNYVVEGDEAHPFHTYNINVKSGTFFAEDIGLDTPWKGPLKNGKVTNINDVEQTVSTDLSTMDRVASTYSRANYTCVRVKRSGDGKTVTLYYTFNTTASFVVDFGTPLTITKEQVSENLAGANLDSVTILSETVSCGSAVVNSDYSITYTPDKRFAKSEEGDTFRVEYKGTQKFTNEDGEIEERVGTVQYTIHIRPASNVLYEENFLTSATATGWTEEKADHNKSQETQKAGETKNAFGYDDTYENVTGQNGAWTIKDLEPKKRSVPLTTEFYGNTFDLIGNCGPTTGRVMLLFKRTDGSYAAVVDIDTRYTKQNIYQVPLAHITLDDGEDANYSVIIYASGLAETTASTQAIATMALDDAADNDELLTQILEENGLTLNDVDYISTAVMQESAGSASPVATMSSKDTSTYAAEAHEAGDHVEINGFRVYRSTSVSEKDNEVADTRIASDYPASEQNVTYWNVLNVAKGVLVNAYVDNKTVSRISVDEYQAAGGPQNEIYLPEGSAVSFKLKDEKITSIQVSLRAVDTATQWNEKPIQSNTEMYYTLDIDPKTKMFTIMNTATAADDDQKLLAIGNIKLPSSVNEDGIISAAEVPEETVLASIQSAYGASNEEPEAFVPETFTAKTTVTPVIRNKVVTLKVNVSSDVAYITVNGVKYTRTGLQGLFQATRTIRVVNTVPKNQTKSYEVVAYNADGVASETITVTG